MTVATPQPIRQAMKAVRPRHLPGAQPYEGLLAINNIQAKGAAELLRARYELALQTLLAVVRADGYVSASRVLACPDPARWTALQVLAGERLGVDGEVQRGAFIPPELRDLVVYVRPWPDEIVEVYIPVLDDQPMEQVRSAAPASMARASNRAGAEVGGLRHVEYQVGPGPTALSWAAGVSLLRLAGKGARKFVKASAESRTAKIVELSAPEVLALTEAEPQKKGGRRGR